MTIALVHKHFDEKHLAEVKSEMVERGAPVIKAVWMEVYGCFAAMEGCHRIRAAKDLGLTPVIEEIEYSDEPSDVEGFLVSEICDAARKSVMIEF